MTLIKLCFDIYCLYIINMYKCQILVILLEYITSNICVYITGR